MRIILPRYRNPAEPAPREEAKTPPPPNRIESTRAPKREPYIDPRHAWAVTG
jgi:hypothetical protein